MAEQGETESTTPTAQTEEIETGVAIALVSGSDDDGGSLNAVQKSPVPVENVQEEEEEDPKEHEDDHRSKIASRTKVVLVVGCVVAVIGLIGMLAAVISSSPLPPSSSRGFAGPSLFRERRTDQALIAYMGGHPGHPGQFNPKGNVKLEFDDDNHFLMTADVEGLEPYCDKCPMSIHINSNCNDVPAGKLFNTKLQRKDPWGVIHYNAVETRTHSSVVVYTGHTASDMEGHVVILGDSMGHPLACGVLERHDIARAVRTLYGDVGNLPAYGETEIGGSVQVHFYKDNTFVFQFQMHGLPASCFRCKIAIQEGTSCVPAEIGSHYWHRLELSVDPWAPAKGAFFSSDQEGIAERSFYLYNGFGYDETKDHAVLIHAADGSRIGCGVLTAKNIRSVFVDAAAPRLMRTEHFHPEGQVLLHADEQVYLP